MAIRTELSVEILISELFLMADDVSLAGVSDYQEDTVGCSSSVNLPAKCIQSIVENVHNRFDFGRTFTDVGGSVLLSVNPCRTVLYYKNDYVDFYRNADSLTKLPHHLYRLCRWCHDNVCQRHLDTCIMFHGESGSGKSRSFKSVLRYLSQIDQGPRVGRMSLILKHIQRILETFGCVWSTNSRASTKFGELLEVGLDFNGYPQHARLTVLPLHKNHLSCRKNNLESNFLIFYILLIGADSQLIKSLKLQRNPVNYAFLKSGAPTNLTHEFWREQFVEFKNSLKEISFTNEEVDEIFKILSLILKIGNIKYQLSVNLDDTTGCCLQDEYELVDICKLIGCDVNLARDALTKKSCSIGADVSLAIDIGEDEAEKLKHFACCTLYSRMWLWISGKINQLCKSFETSDNRKIQKFYLLDSSGYDINAINNDSFDQYLSNYAKERVHEFFINKNFKEKQSEFIAEGLQWENIETNFDDFPAVIDLENSLTSLNRIDNDVDKQVAGSFKNMIKHENHQTTTTTTICHYFGKVQYDAKSFREKNSMTISHDYLQLFRSSSLSLLITLFPENEALAAKLQKKTLSSSSQYKVALNAILKTIDNAECAHVICLKSNDLNRPAFFDDQWVERQLKCFGVAELVQLYSAGFAEHQMYEDCLNRYKMLSPQTWPKWSSSARQGLMHVMKSVNVPCHHFALGRRKIFFKSIETIAQLEECRRREMHRLASVIQHAFRTWMIRHKNKDVNKSQSIIAARFRAFKARKEYKAKKKAAVLIAVHFRRWKVRRLFRLKREHDASIVIFQFLRTACKKIYLIRLVRNLPSLSPTCHQWPVHMAPSFCREADALIRVQYYRWRCRRYRHLIDQQTYFRLREKVAASTIFNGKKTGYALTVAHSFRGDYVRIRQNPRWRRVAAETGDEYVVFADIASKVHRTSGKVSSVLLVISTSGILILDHRTLILKHRAPVVDVDKISMSPYNDPIAVFHMKNSQLSSKQGDFVFECRHIVELIAKLYLVIQNSTGKPPLIVISQDIAFEVDGEKLQLVFNRKNDLDQTSDDGSATTTGCFTTSPSLMTMRPSTPGPGAGSVANNKTPPSTSRSSDEVVNPEMVQSPQIHRLKLVRKGTRLDIFV